MKTTRRGVLGLLAAAATVVGVPSFWIYRMKTYAGPVSDHFDGTHFFDPDGSPPKKLSEVLRWQFGSAKNGPNGCRARIPIRRRRASTAKQCGSRLSAMRVG